MLLPLSPFRSIVKDYFLICESYYNADPRARARRRSRRSTWAAARLHNEGSELLRERLAEKRRRRLSTPRAGSSPCSASCISEAERAMARLPSSVLFACTLELDPLAHGGGDAEAASRPAHLSSIRSACAPAQVDPFAVAVMDEIGIDISQHQAKTFDDLEDTSFDLVVSLSPEAQHQAVELTRTMACEVEFWPVFDPTAVEGSRDERLDAYRVVRDHLQAPHPRALPAARAARRRRTDPGT